MDPEKFDRIVNLLGNSMLIATDKLLPIIGKLGLVKEIGKPPETMLALLLCAATLNHAMSEDGKGVSEETFSNLSGVAFAAAPTVVSYLKGELDEDAA